MRMLRACSAAGLLLLTAWAGACQADDKPDTLALMKQYPKFVEAIRTTDLNTRESTLRLTLCRSRDENCESFDADSKQADTLADYVYLCAVYDNDCRHGEHAKTRGKNADALIQEAKDKGYGQALLDHYSAEYDCGQAKDIAACVLHKLFTAARVHRTIAEGDRDSVYYVEAGEDGEGDPFGE